MAPSFKSSESLFQAWRQAEIVVEMAEKSWAAILDRSDISSEEKLQRKRELIEARTIALKLFQQIFDAIIPDLPLDWKALSQCQPTRTEENRPER